MLSRYDALLTKWTEKYPKIKTEFEAIDQTEFEEVKQERIDVQEVLEIDLNNLDKSDANKSEEYISIDTDQSQLSIADPSANIHSTPAGSLKQPNPTPKTYPVGNPIPTSFLYLPPNPMIPSSGQMAPTDQSEMGYLAQLGAKKAQKKEFQRNEDGFFPCECRFSALNLVDFHFRRLKNFS